MASTAVAYNRARAKRRGVVQERANKAQSLKAKSYGITSLHAYKSGPSNNEEAAEFYGLLEHVCVQELETLRERLHDESERRMYATRSKFIDLVFRELLKMHASGGRYLKRQDAANVVGETYYPEGENELGDRAPTGVAVLSELNACPEPDW